MAQPEERPAEEIGTVSVDSGNLVIVDPRYLTQIGLANDESIGLCVGYSREPDYTHLPEHNRQLEEDRRTGCAPILGGLGITLMPGFGDGEYTVSVRRTDEGRIAKLEVTFIDDKPAADAE